MFFGCCVITDGAWCHTALTSHIVFVHDSGDHEQESKHNKHKIEYAGEHHKNINTLYVLSPVLYSNLKRLPFNMK